jgi:hypothetical protein
LKPSFNKSGQNWLSAPQKGARRGRSRQRKQQGLVMASITSASVPSPAGRRHGANPLAEIRAFWRQFFARAFNPYRPELYYMRGPGPAWRAKQTATRQHST